MFMMMGLAGLERDPCPPPSEAAIYGLEPRIDSRLESYAGLSYRPTIHNMAVDPMSYGFLLPPGPQANSITTRDEKIINIILRCI